MGIVGTSFVDDIKQVCMMAVMKSLESYNYNKCDNFWGYAYPIMQNYAKHELNLLKNTIHIPFNRISKSFKNYDNVEIYYNSIDESNLQLESNYCEIELMLDIENVINTFLKYPDRNVVKMRIGVEKTITGKTDFDSIGKTLNLPMQKVRKIYLESQSKLKKYFML